MPQLEWYRFCDVVLGLSARRPQAQADFGRVYGAFRIAGAGEPPPEGGAPVLTCHLDTDSTGKGQIDLVEASYPVSAPDPGSAYALSLIFDRVAAHSRSQLFIHAAAVSLDDRAVLLAGPSGHGKSTLARALADHGATVLCDDVAPLEIASGMVSSFPLRRSDTPGQLAAPVAGVCLLQPRTSRRALRLAIDRLPGEWENSAPWGARAQIVGSPTRGCWEIIADDAPPGMMEEIVAACGEAGVVILRDLSLAAAQFGEAPQVISISGGAGLPQLMGNLFGRQGRPLTEVGWRLACALQQARFWQVSPGRPELTAAALLEAVGVSREQAATGLPGPAPA